MGIAGLDYTGVKGGLGINGIIQDYYVYAGEKVNAGDFVEFINGIANTTTEKSSSYVFTNTSTMNGHFTAGLLDENTLVVAFQNLGDGVKGYATVGKVSNSVITFGEKYLFCSSRTEELDICKISEDKVAISYTSDYKTTAIIATISGTVMTFGSALSIGGGSASSTERDTQIITTEENRLLLAWTYGVVSTSTSYGMKACVLTVNGTTLSKATIQTVEVNAHNSLSLLKLSNNSAFLAYGDNATTTAGARVLTTSGTTVTTNTEYTVANYKPIELTASLVSANTILIALANSSRIGGAVVATVSGTSITVGTEYIFNNNETVEDISSCKTSDNKCFISFSDRQNSYYGIGIIATISGKNITFGNKYIIEEIFMKSLNVVSKNDSSVLVIYANGTNSYYGEVKMLNVADTTISDNLVFSNYETQVRPATALPCKGVAKTSGEGGDSTGHKDIVSVHLPSTFYKQFNLAVNGDFSSGMSGWTVSATNYFTTKATTKGGENCVEIILTTPTTAGTNHAEKVISQSVNALNMNHVYYFGYRYYGDSGNNNFRPIVGQTNGTGTQYFATATDCSVPAWQLVSERKECTVAGNSIHLALFTQNANSELTAGMKMYFTNFKVYDLTAMFGAGNEPTKEWCDANL